MSNQHHGIAQELEERKRLDDDQSILASDETQNSYWALLEAVPVPGGAPESGDEIMCEDAGAKQIDPGLDTHEADSERVWSISQATHTPLHISDHDF